MWLVADCCLALTTGLGTLTPQCLVSIDCPLDLTTFRLWYDLDEHSHDYTGPEGPSKRMEQVS
jgi:hypothetical protein